MTAFPLPQWFDVASDAKFSDPKLCAQKANAFEKTIYRRNVIEYVAGFVVTGLFSAAAIGALIFDQSLIALSFGAIVIGIVAVLWNLKRRASNLEQRAEDTCLDHLRRQYQHQFEALRDVPVWYIGPLVPGIVLFLFVVTVKVAENQGWAVALKGIAGPAAVTFGIFTAIIALNLVAARALKRKIKQLDELA
ncbi:hypothetical protein [uncultured Erythrobacter sp.]|uniref:hypothetical protein n=1 Tax=uncultured Erythrobacter sp. TaxID=263913 RepID=UPI0026378EB0|nr:hypothetical protein [uncultured Erythrobacter sp.]